MGELLLGNAGGGPWTTAHRRGPRGVGGMCGRNVCRVLVVVGFQNEAPWLYDGGGARLTPLLPLNHANNAGNDPDSVLCTACLCIYSPVVHTQIFFWCCRCRRLLRHSAPTATSPAMCMSVLRPTPSRHGARCSRLCDFSSILFPDTAGTAPFRVC